MLVDLNRLRVFLEIHRSGSASAAAQLLSVSQSAVSQSLSKLEAELDTQLFVRRHRGLVPTPAANRLAAVMAPFEDALADGLAEIQRARNELAGTLRVGAPVELGARRLPALLAGFRREHPDVRFELSLGHPSETVPRVQEGELDLAFTDVFDSAPWAGLDVAPLFEEQLVLVASRVVEREHLEGARGYRELARVPFVAYHRSAPDVRRWFRHHYRKAPTQLDVVLSVESVQAVLASVAAGIGFGLVPAHATADHRDASKLVVVETRRRPLVHGVGLVRLLDKVPSRLERTFVRWIESTRWD